MLKILRSFPHLAHCLLWVLCGLLACLSAGCSLFPSPRPDPTRYYVLTAPALAEATDSVGRGRLTIGLRAVSVAPYLEGKAMVTRRGEHEVVFHDDRRWAEPLAVSVHRILRQVLQADPAIRRVYSPPFPFDAERDVDVYVQILRAEGRVAEDGQAAATLVACFEIVRADKDGGGGEVLVRELFQVEDLFWREGDAVGLAAALSTQVNALARTLAARLPVE